MISMDAFVDELQKIAEQAPPGLAALVRKAVTNPKVLVPASIFGAGAATMHYGGKEVEKYRLGRQVYNQMHSQGQ